MALSRLAGTSHRLLFGLAALAGLGLVGCGPAKYYPVRGQVVFHENGQPVTEGEVRFQSVAKPDIIASGKIGPDGKFSLSTPSHGEGVLEGQCRAAVIVPPRNGKPVIHEKFADFDTADKKFTVVPRGEGEENFFLIEVSRSKR